MPFIELLILSVALAMDAMAVTLSNALCEPNMKRKKALMMPAAFGIFQGIMPIIGFFLGSIFSTFLMQYSGYIVFGILGFLGSRMIWEGVKELRSPGGCELPDEKLTYKTILLQAVATSIDAMAVGVTFAALDANVWTCALVIALITALCCFISLKLGSKIGLHFGPAAEAAGGVVLVIIGIKALL